VGATRFFEGISQDREAPKVQFAARP